MKIKFLLLLNFFTILSSNAQVSCNIIITSREGKDVSSLASIKSDNIHIVVSDFSTLVSAQYQLYDGENPPSDWDSVVKHNFQDDLYFYKKESNQHIRILIESSSGITTAKTLELLGGILTQHVDDPILPIDFVRGMAPSGLIVEGDSFREVYPETAVIAMKKAGFKHVRIHIGRHLKDKKTLNPTDEVFFKNLDSWVEQISRHGMYCHLGNKARSQAEMAMSEEDPLFIETVTNEMVNFFDMIAERYKYSSHRFAFHVYLESGSMILFNKEHKDELNIHYAKITEAIRLHDSTRNLIYPPGGINDPERLGELTFPYPDLDLGDNITTGSGLYFFSDFHKSFAGGGWHPGDNAYETKIAAAKKWSARTKIPLIMSAVNVIDREEYPTADRVAEIKQLFIDVNSGVYPIPITFLKLKDFYNDKNDIWTNNLDLRARLEAINGIAKVDKEDPDGDFLTTTYENTVSGTNPNLADSDGDNISDFIECFVDKMNPLDPSDGFFTSDLSINGDYDGDGISNAKELELAEVDVSNKIVKEVLNITDPNDSDLCLNGSIPNVWESILKFDIASAKTRWAKLGGSISDSEGDHDKDGILTKDEVKVNTWPLIIGDRRGRYDVDNDFNVVGTFDPTPYIHDSNHIVSYSFNDSKNILKNEANQGNENTGVLVGDSVFKEQHVFYFNGNTLVDIPNVDFLTLSNRTINFHFYVEDNHKKQLLYKEGDLANGISIAIVGGNLVASIWKTVDGNLSKKNNTIGIGKDAWYAVTLCFDGKQKALKTSLYSKNRLLYRGKSNVSYSSINIPASASISLGGSTEDTRILLKDKSKSKIIGNNYFVGFMDDVHIYNRVLSETEISLLSRNDLYPAKEPDFKSLKN